jgi:hypothetical protein
LVFTRGRKSDGVGSVPVELGRMSQAVTITIRPSFGNTSRSSAPNPRAIQTYSVESGSLDIRKNIHVLSESYEEKGVCLKINANPGTVAALKRRLAS